MRFGKRRNLRDGACDEFVRRRDRDCRQRHGSVDMEMHGFEWRHECQLFRRHPEGGRPPLDAAAFGPTGKRRLRLGKRGIFLFNTHDEHVQYGDSERFYLQLSNMELALHGVGWRLECILSCHLVLVVNIMDCLIKGDARTKPQASGF